MRELKFRAWDNVTLKMSPPFALFGEFTLLGAVHDWQHEMGHTAKTSLEALGSLEVMQFCGLHDKNGKEIFEGDFFQRPVKINKSLHGEWTIYQFMIKNGNTIISYLRSEKDTGIPEGYMAALYTDELDIDMKTLMFAKEVTLHEVEILGNIHEHKHLLE